VLRRRHRSCRRLSLLCQLRTTDRVPSGVSQLWDKLQTPLTANRTYTYTVAGVATTTPTHHHRPCKPTAWKRDMTVWPEAVPTYASACVDADAYRSACSCYGFTAAPVTTGTTTTITETVWVAPTGWTTVDGGWVAPTWSADPSDLGSYNEHCKAATTTVYSVSGSQYTWAPEATVTKTITTATCGSYSSYSSHSSYSSYSTYSTYSTTTHTPSPTPSACLTDADALTIVNDFINLLEVTNVGGVFNTTLANLLLASDFTDVSDSINFLANITVCLY